MLNRWYYGNTKRVEAEKMLRMAHSIPGTYLVRDSESKPGDYSLSGIFGSWCLNYHC